MYHVCVRIAISMLFTTSLIYFILICRMIVILKAGEFRFCFPHRYDFVIHNIFILI